MPKERLTGGFGGTLRVALSSSKELLYSFFGFFCLFKYSFKGQNQNRGPSVRAKEEQPKPMGRCPRILTPHFSGAKISGHGCHMGDIWARCGFLPHWWLFHWWCLVVCKGGLLWLTQVRKEFFGKAMMYFRELGENQNDQASCIRFWFLCFFGFKFTFWKKKDCLVKFTSLK